VFVATALVPLLIIEGVSWTAESLASNLPTQVSTRWFRNTGAFVGIVERPLMLGSLVAGHAEFIGVWLVFKGIAGYRVGLKNREAQERRLFQLFLLNNALSIACVGIGWLLWLLFNLPLHNAA
jgi:hypothetical protein